MRGTSEDEVDDTPTLPRRSTLADRLKAEQHKRDEPHSEAPQQREEPKVQTKPQPKPQGKMLPLKPPQDETSSAEAPETTSAAPSPKHLTRTRRPAGPPPQRRLSAPANDDIPSIGGLIFALQQRPARTPFLIALAASVAWFLIGGFFAFGVISDASSTASAILSSTAAILVPIVVFWFLALLVWRAQELRLMASAMTEVAVRLAEPDKLAEQSVASVGQTIRRQVAAMNDAISRAIGRASELKPWCTTRSPRLSAPMARTNCVSEFDQRAGNGARGAHQQQPACERGLERRHTDLARHRQCQRIDRSEAVGARDAAHRTPRLPLQRSRRAGPARADEFPSDLTSSSA